MTSSSQGGYLTIDEFIQLAILFETESAEFYHDLGQKVESDEVTDLLAMLEDQEHEHERILRDYTVETDPSSMLQFPPSLSLSLPVPDSDNPAFEEMLSIAIEREIRSREIYEKAADLVSGDFKKLLTGLAVFERQHEEKLRSLKSYY